MFLKNVPQDGGDIVTTPSQRDVEAGLDTSSKADASQATHGCPDQSKFDGLPRRGNSSDRFDVYERLFVYCGLAMVAMGLFYIGIDFEKSPLERTTSARVAMLALEFMEFAVGIALLLGGLAFSAQRGQKSHLIDRGAIFIGIVVIALSLLMQTR